MASSSRNLMTVENRRSFSSKNSRVHFVEGKLLSISDVDKILTNSTKLNESEKKMLEALTNMKPHRFQHIQQEFSVSHLQHVTDMSSMEGIYKEECFKIKTRAFRDSYKDLSFWSADIAVKDISEARKKACAKAKELITRMSKTDEKKIRAQFANSPVFNKSASRYGNFKFSFQISDLLSLYQTQHCGDKEPQLRILGTDLFKQEITHYILVHSPDQSDQFQNLEMVPTVKDSFGPHFVYLKDQKVYWRPESTSISLKEKISMGSFARKKCYQHCKYYSTNGSCVHTKEINSVWNHLVFTFHLPIAKNCSFHIQKEKLLKSLKACKTSKLALISEDKRLDVKQARDIIQKMKSDAKSQKRKRPEVPKAGPAKTKRTQDPPPQSEPPLHSGDTTGPGPAKTRRTQAPPPKRAYFR